MFYNLGYLGVDALAISGTEIDDQYIIQLKFNHANKPSIKHKKILEHTKLSKIWKFVLKRGRVGSLLFVLFFFCCCFFCFAHTDLPCTFVRIATTKMWPLLYVI